MFNLKTIFTPVSFVYPSFLWALTLLSIPVIIHLFNFRRYRTIYFTNVRFLRNIQEETATKNKLKHLLILIARIFAVAFLVFAFAQPFIPIAENSAKPTSKAVSIYIDNSFSMETVANDLRLLDLAKKKAAEIADAYRVDDKFQLLTNDFEAGHQRLVNKEAFLQILAQIQISPEVKNTDEIIKRQKDILLRADEEQKSVFLISDFQKNITEITADSAVQINLVPLVSNEVRNLAIDSVWFISPVQLINQPSALCVRVHNYGEEDIENATLNLKVNGNVKGIADMQIPAGAMVTDTLNFTVNEGTWQQGELSVLDYPVTFDDVFYFTYQPVAQLPVLCLYGDSQNKYLQSLFSGNQVFAYTEMPIAQINVNELDKYSLIILNEATSLSSGVADMLSSLISKGISVVVIPSLNMDITTINNFLLANNAGTFSSLVDNRRNVTTVNTAHTLFDEVFEKIPQNIALPFTEKSFAIHSTGRQLTENVLVFGDETPFLAGYKSGSGAVYVFAAPLQNAVTDFPVQGGLFVPLFFRIAVLSESNTPIYTTIGREQWIMVDIDNIPADATLTVSGTNGEFIPALRRSGNKVEINVSPYSNNAGIYTIQNTPNGQMLALNYDRSESDLQFYSEKELKEMYSDQNIRIISNAAQNIAGTVIQLNEGKTLWKICIILALAFLAIEVLLIRFLP